MMYDVFRFVYLKSLILFGWELPQMRNFDNHDEFCFLLVVTFMVRHTTRAPQQWMRQFLAFYLNKTQWMTEKDLPCSMVGRTGEVVQHSFVLNADRDQYVWVYDLKFHEKKKPNTFFFFLDESAGWLIRTSWLWRIGMYRLRAKNYFGLSSITLIVMYHQMVYLT